jgi:hypothetical protein
VIGDLDKLDEDPPHWDMEKSALGGEMTISESCAQEALKVARPFQEVEKLAVAHAIAAVNELRAYNERYAEEHKGMDDSFVTVRAENAREDEPVVRALSRHYLVLANRRGLVGVDS